MQKENSIYVAGHNGLVGSAIIRKLKKEGYNNIITKTSKELDLRNKDEVDIFFYEYKPEFVFFAAGTVGGILANKTYPADFIYNNISIISNTINAAYKNNVMKLLYLGSSCIYPKDAKQPIKEEFLMTGALEETNRPYAIAKIAGIELCQSYNAQYKTNYISLMPTNLFGINDNYNSQNSHLIAALIRKFYEAKINNLPFVELWGSGTPRREILSSDQLADACFYFMKNYDGGQVINIGSGVDFTIKEIAEMIKEISGYTGELIFDSTKPNGIMKKQLDVTYATKNGWESSGILEIDLRKTYDDFVLNYNYYINKK